MVIYNHHPENINIVIDKKRYEISAHSSIEVKTDSFSIECEIFHKSNVTDWDNSFSDKIIESFSTITAIVVDSKYIISEIKDTATLDITNEIVEHKKDDVCMIYHGVTCKNAKIELVDCWSCNIDKLLKARKLLLLGDANDFPIISPIIAMIKYKRLKKITSQHNLWDIVYGKTTFLL